MGTLQKKVSELLTSLISVGLSETSVSLDQKVKDVLEQIGYLEHDLKEQTGWAEQYKAQATTYGERQDAYLVRLIETVREIHELNPNGGHNSRGSSQCPLCSKMIYGENI